MRILVAGGAGFIGSHLVDKLLHRHDIEKLIVVDNLWTGCQNNLAHIRDNRFEFLKADVETVRFDVKFDEIYHLASPASPPWYMSAPLKTISANVMGTANLLTLLADGGVIAFTSTSEVCGDPLVSPQPETYRGSVDCTGPRSSYDESKRCSEAMLFEAHRVHGYRIKVVRLFNVYGPRTKEIDGRAVSNFISQALRGQPITVYGDGLNRRSWGYIDDIVDALERYFWKDGVDYIGPLNVGNTREIAVIDVAKFVQKLVPGSSIAFCPPVPQDPTNRCPDLGVINRIIPGWSCHVAYEAGVENTLAWFKTQLFA